MGSHYKGSKKELRALNTYIKFRRASHSLSSYFNNELRKEGLSESQFNVLDTLYHLGTLSQKQLGEKLLKTGGNITMVVDNLEKNGYVKREKVKNDRRVLKVSLTGKGKRRIEKLLPVIVKSLTEKISVLSKSEQSDLQKLCKKLGLKSR